MVLNPFYEDLIFIKINDFKSLVCLKIGDIDFATKKL